MSWSHGGAKLLSLKTGESPPESLARAKEAELQVTIGLPSVGEVVRAIARAFRLTPRETAILGATAEGQAAKEIAFNLRISRRTVDCYWRKIFAKLGCHSQLQALALLLRHAAPGAPAAPGPGAGDDET